MMSTKVVISVLVCAFIAIAQCAPQFDQQYTTQPEKPGQEKRFEVLDGNYHQDPNLEYDFQLVLPIAYLSILRIENRREFICFKYCFLT